VSALPVTSAFPSRTRDLASRAVIAMRRLMAVCALAGLGLVLARAPLTWAVALVAGAAGGLLLLRRPVLGLYALAVAIPVGSLGSVSVGGYGLTLAQPLLFATLGAAAAQNMATRRVPHVRSPLMVGTLVLLAALALSLLNAYDLSSAGTELLKWIEFGLLLAVVSSATGVGESRWLVAALLAGGAVEGLLGIYQFLFQVGPPGFVLLGRYMRAYGTFAQPNPYGGYLGMLIPLACAVVVTRWRRHVAGVRISIWGNRLLWWLALAALVTMGAGLLMSWSRGALLGAVVGLVLMALALARRTWPWLVALALVVLVSAPVWQPLVPGDYLSRLDDTTAYLGQDLGMVEIDDANFAVIERLAHWQAAWRMFSMSPWTGVGVGQYATVYPTVALARWQDPLGHAHNYYLHLLAESGLLGLAAYLWLMVAALLAAWKRARQSEGWPRTLALGALGMLGHLLTHSLVDNLYVQDLYLLVAIVLGMLFVHGELRDESSVSASSHLGTDVR
jgi:putative inorganic carbon (HCO3(-)) transporter